MVSIESRFGNTRSYQLNKAQLNKLNTENSGKESAVKEPEKKQEKRRDIYMEMPVRALGYTNEVGEALRPVIGSWAWASWVPAIGYIAADVVDKYKQDEYGNQDPSGERGAKQLSNQLLASVALPTFAVKAGQTAVDMLSGLSKSGLAFSKREKISDFVINSMNTGEHNGFLNEAGKVDKKAFTDSLIPKMSETIKHKKTHNMLMKPLVAMRNWLANPHLKNPKKEDVNNYIGQVVDRLVENRQNLLDGVKPAKMSDKMFKKFTKDTQKVAEMTKATAEMAGNMPKEDVAELIKVAKKSIAFDYVRKMEKSHVFKNKILLSAGGFVALSLLAKPIDHFVENVVIKKAVEPAIAMVKGKGNDKTPPTENKADTPANNSVKA